MDTERARNPDTERQREGDRHREGAEGLSGSHRELRQGNHPARCWGVRMGEGPGMPSPHSFPSNLGLVLHAAPHGLILHLRCLVLI